MRIWIHSILSLTALSSATASGPHGFTSEDCAFLFRGHPNTIGTHLLTSAQFGGFLKSRDLSWEDIPAEKRLEILPAYLEDWFKSYENLEAMQEEVLRKKLTLHGVATEGYASSYGALRKNSSDNVRRYIAKRYQSSPGSEEAEKAVSDLQLKFVHFTHLPLNGPPKGFLLSSRELENAGATPGLNTYPFNKNVIQSDGHVFFYAVFQRHGQEEGFKSEYGNAVLYLNESYAADRGWVSAFMMYQVELRSWAERAFPNTLARAINELERKQSALITNGQGRSAAYSELSSEVDRAYHQVIGKLHLTDFTVDDFSGLIKNELLNYLSHLKVEQPEAYQQAISILRGGSVDKIQEFLATYIYAPLKLPSQFEFKVPVAVPANELRFRTKSETTPAVR